MLGKLKSFLLDDAAFYALLLVCIGVIAFGLGRSSVGTVANTAAGVHVLQSDEPVQAIESTDFTLVASRSGTKYHLLTCPGAKQIKEENKLFFTTVAQAKAAGYGPAANCEGL